MCAVVIFPQNINIGVHCPVILDLWTSKTGDSGIFEERGLKAMAKWDNVCKAFNTNQVFSNDDDDKNADDFNIKMTKYRAMLYCFKMMILRLSI